MADKIKTSTVLKLNFRELIVIFLAFALMGLSAYFFIGRILRGHLMDRTEEIMYTAGANIRAGLSEAETTLLNSYYIVQGMLRRDASKQEILDYLTATTEWMQRQEQGLLGFYGIFGYINGEFYDSIGLNPSSDYIPQRRPWYQTAVRSGNTIAYTAPYEDLRTGDIIVSAVRNIDLEDGSIIGILVVDINVNWLEHYISSLTPAAEGYGMLVSQNMTIMAHPKRMMIGRQLQDLNAAYADIAHSLRIGQDVSARRLSDSGPNGLLVTVFFTRIFNGWYVGIVIPYFDFYHDLYFSAIILIALGLLLSVLLAFIQIRLSIAKMKSDEESKSKSSFLASMSHEIRTPINAITGMSELLLRGQLSDEARGYAQDIRQAGGNLLSIVNDILDLSKIEAGKLEIISVNYMLSSLVHDTVNIIRMRLGDKPIRFYTKIDGKIPNGLNGDEVRLRQILLNLLSNAVKYSEKGSISLSITIDRMESKKVWLKIDVSDTGKGIKPEDKEKLFVDFTQIDTKKNRGIEGTGLGLAITKRLCHAMNGDIIVESEYGQGSTFTVIIPQEIVSEDPFAAVEDVNNRKTLVYEDRAVYARAVRWALENMKVPYKLVMNTDDFSDALLGEEWYLVLTAYNLHKDIKPVMDQDDSAFYENKKPQLALMVERGTEDYIPNVRFVSLPTLSLSLANVLNGKSDNQSYSGSSGSIRFAIPHVRMLVVDDISTNLKVAEGLLAPYHAMVDTSLSGIHAIELIKVNNYDIIFMDHMMPEMDGIETTTAIRAWEKEQQDKKEIPIIALTANAVVGMREMFMEKGFSDFLAKPIDVSKLDEILDKWIPKDKREKLIEEESSPVQRSYSLLIPGVDTIKGITMTGGTVDLYMQVLSLFRKDAQERISVLKTAPSEGTLRLFITQVHALKSASAALGAADLSDRAAQLEAAGKAGNMNFIQENLHEFTVHLEELADNIGAALDLYGKGTEPGSSAASAEKSATDTSALVPLFNELADALHNRNTSAIDNIMESLAEQEPDSAMQEMLDQLSDTVLIAEFDSALNILGTLRKNYG